ncbi:hypothetical protein ACH5RR_040523 [Cinchona calisaya]|uniref:Uncharacterized protein n=1 Tax=Cinchona calisaya TaxID=153742 RepID=A0ABD2XT59_9GENT
MDSGYDTYNKGPQYGNWLSASIDRMTSSDKKQKKEQKTSEGLVGEANVEAIEPKIKESNNDASQPKKLIPAPKYTSCTLGWVGSSGRSDVTTGDKEPMQSYINISEQTRWTVKDGQEMKLKDNKKSKL